MTKVMLPLRKADFLCFAIARANRCCSLVYKIHESAARSDMVPEYPKQIARIGAVLTLLGSLIWIQWPIDFEKFSFAAVILLIGSFMAWMSIELAELSGSESSSQNTKSDDVDKFNSLLKFIDRNQFYILKYKSIQTFMNSDDYKGLSNLISHYESDIFPFNNSKIQISYIDFCSAASEFHSEFYGLYTSDGRGSSTWRPSGDGYVNDEIFKSVMSKIAALDRKASKLALLWENFIKVSRKELKGASKMMERYDT